MIAEVGRGDVIHACLPYTCKWRSMWPHVCTLVYVCGMHAFDYIMGGMLYVLTNNHTSGICVRLAERLQLRGMDTSIRTGTVKLLHKRLHIRGFIRVQLRVAAFYFVGER